MRAVKTAMDTAVMRAVSPASWGGPELLREIEVIRPEPGPGEILVRVKAAGVNATDWKSRATGGLGLWDEPAILGHDVSGVVEAVGIGVRLFEPGDEVFGMPRFPHQAGAYAQYLAAPARHFARKPHEIDHIEAAALPLASLTAWQALVDTAHVEAGQRVLIHAAAGGVGHLAVQVAKALGAYVIGTARKANHAFVYGLGADEVVDYTTLDFAAVVRDIDIVFDLVGGDCGKRSLEVLTSGGTLVSLAAPAEEALVPQAAKLGVRAGFMLVEPDHFAMNAIADLVAAGRLRPRVDTVLPLWEAPKAHAIGEQGHTVGKMVLTLGD
ncbi:NADP-dependent oxidoreductase [Streptomyces sp. NPDC051940]|uniref:NADP-dependent oxidoreductase n=1 Tax=Streptomyces sp. NPDC051940 TaxID=3155675 RepID=UPI00343D0248